MMHGRCYPYDCGLGDAPPIVWMPILGVTIVVFLVLWVRSGDIGEAAKLSIGGVGAGVVILVPVAGFILLSLQIIGYFL